MISDSYFTVKTAGKGLYKEKGSKFLAFSRQVETEEEVKEFIAELKKQFHDARHHCYAYVLGPGKTKSRANDDGEPSGSAGLPILNQIRSKDLTDTAILVVRYYGGNKLGISGLAAAYKTAALYAIENSEIEERILYRKFSLRFEYALSKEVMRMLKGFETEVFSRNFTADCRMKIGLRLAEADRFIKKAEALYGLDFEKQIEE